MAPISCKKPITFESVYNELEPAVKLPLGQIARNRPRIFKGKTMHEGLEPALKLCKGNIAGSC